MTYRKKLIEVALPLEAINVASAREKLLRHGHPSTLHLWWARRPLAACRAVIFASLVGDPNDPDAPPDFVAACRKLPRGKNAAEEDTPRQRLFDFLENLVQWESTTDERILTTAYQLIELATGGNPPPLLDPFAGGGSIPLEGQRLHLESHAYDLNPVAVMIEKAMIDIPPRFADTPSVNPQDRMSIARDASWKGTSGLYADLLHYGEWMREQAQNRIGHLYPKGPNGETVVAWLWARTVKSPNPAVEAQVPLIKSYWLSSKKGKEAWIEPVIDRQKGSYRFEVRKGKPKDPKAVDSGTKAGRATFSCVMSGAPITADYLRAEGISGRIGSRLMAIVVQGPKGRSYCSPTSEHEDIAASAKPYWEPETELVDNPRHMSPPLYGMTHHRDLFTSRQLVALATFSDLVAEARKKIKSDAIAAGLPDDDTSLSEGGVGARAYSEAISVYLAFAVDRFADYWSSLNRWQSTNQQLSNTFARQALPMMWDYVEANPFSGQGGSFDNLFKWTIQSVPNLPLSSGGVALQHDAAIPVNSNRAFLISTDPPYYDNVPYADLSDYFYIWLRRSLKDVYPDIFSTLLVPKYSELVADYKRYGNHDEANTHFEEGLTKAFENMCQIAHKDYPLSVFYAFRQTEEGEDSTDNGASTISSTGWETMLAGLIKAGFAINGTWPVRTELPNRTRGFESNALASSIVLVCRPRPNDAPVTSRREFVNQLRRELPSALQVMQSGNIAPVDLAQASIGPGMAVYSRYRQVLEPNGERLSVRSALQLINQELDAYLAEQEGEMDEDSRFAVAWFEQFGFREGAFGQADVLARAKNTSVDGLASAGLLETGAGKVRLYPWSELDPDWDPTTDRRLTTWEAVHHLIQQLNTHGEEGAARLLAKMSPDLAAEARQLAYRLYSICERKSWAEHARDYNALVISWGASQEQAREFRQQYQQGKLF